MCYKNVVVVVVARQTALTDARDVSLLAFNGLAARIFSQCDFLHQNSSVSCLFSRILHLALFSLCQDSFRRGIRGRFYELTSDIYIA